MRTRFRRCRSSAAAVAVLTIVAGTAWAMVSGQVALVVTHGVSMLPAFHSGDLAVVARSDNYGPGDIVAYRSDVLHTTVLHRIVGVADGHYRFKGDHNSWVDPEQPTQAAFVGRLWLHVPRAGALLVWLRTPAHAALVVLPCFLLAGAGGAKRVETPPPPDQRARSTGRDVPRQLTPGAADRQKSPTPATAEHLKTLVWPMAGAVLCGLLSLYAFQQPLMRPSSRTVGYEEQVAFAYSAPATAGTTYPTSAVVTGGPIFLRLVNRLDIAADFRLSAPAEQRVAGTMSLDAEVTGPGQWTRTMPLAGPTPFRGGQELIRAHVNLPAVLAMLKAVQNETGVAGGRARLAILAHVRLAGAIATVPVTEDFAPSITFLLDSRELLLESGAGGAGGASVTNAGGSGTGSGSDARLAPSRSASVRLPATAPRRLGVRGRQVDVRTARRAGLLGALGFLVGAMVVLVVQMFRRPRSQVDLIQAHYGHELLRVQGPPGGREASFVDVVSFSALLHLGERYDCPILHQITDVDHRYFVDTPSSVYRLVIADRPTASEEVDPPSLPAADSVQQLCLPPGAPPAALPAAPRAVPVAAPPTVLPAARTRPNPAPIERTIAARRRNRGNRRGAHFKSPRPRFS